MNNGASSPSNLPDRIYRVYGWCLDDDRFDPIKDYMGIGIKVRNSIREIVTGWSDIEVDDFYEKVLREGKRRSNK